MADCFSVNCWKSLLTLFSLAGLAGAQDLPLPTARPFPPSGDDGTLKPTLTIRPPTASNTAKPTDAREEALKEAERQILAEQAAKSGNITALKQLIVMQGPLDSAVFRAPKPPASIEGKVTIIGLKHDDKVVKNLEQFFGVPLTTEREKQLLETVKSQLAGKETHGMDVKVAGWWPNEGVMALALVPSS
jgi:hypothetical protein